MKATLEFDVPGEASKFVDAFNSVHWKAIVEHVVNWAMEKQQSNGDSVMDELLEEIAAMMRERNLQF